MNHLGRLQDLLPPLYSSARDAVVSGLLDVIALELEIFDEDLDRMRQTHWVRHAYRLNDAAKIGALVGIAPFPWEDLRSFRERLVALVTARLRGALGPREIREFVYSYLTGAERVTGAMMVPGLQSVSEAAAFRRQEPRPRFRPLALVENPVRQRTSRTLQARGGRVPYLFRWKESNGGLAEAAAGFHISGMPRRRTAVPVLVNLTTGDLIGYEGRVAFGQTLSVRASGAATTEAPRAAIATLDGHDVTADLFSMQGFVPGRPFARDELDAVPNVPRMSRGLNEWIFLSIGLFDIKGLNSVFFAIARDELREGAFDDTAFDRALFPSGTVAQLQLEWTEIEPASFEVRVPRYITSEPASAGDEPLYQRAGAALRGAVADLHAAGVRAEVRFEPFAESQPQVARVRLPWLRFDPEAGPTGTRDEMTIGGRFGQTSLGGSRFE